jgi:hypothetical protein
VHDQQQQRSELLKALEILERAQADVVAKAEAAAMWQTKAELPAIQLQQAQDRVRALEGAARACPVEIASGEATASAPVEATWVHRDQTAVVAALAAGVAPTATPARGAATSARLWCRSASRADPGLRRLHRRDTHPVARSATCLVPVAAERDALRNTPERGCPT